MTHHKPTRRRTKGGNAKTVGLVGALCGVVCFILYIVIFNILFQTCPKTGGLQCGIPQLLVLIIINTLITLAAVSAFARAILHGRGVAAAWPVAIFGSLAGFWLANLGTFFLPPNIFTTYLAWPAGFALGFWLAAAVFRPGRWPQRRAINYAAVVMAALYMLSLAKLHH